MVQYETQGERRKQNKDRKPKRKSVEGKMWAGKCTRSEAKERKEW